MPFRRRITMFSLLALTALAHADGKTAIDASDSDALVAAKGTTVTVQGKVENAKWSSSGAVCTIEFEDAPKFMAAAFGKTKDKLDAAFGGDFAKQIKGSMIKISGKIAPYGGKDDRYKDSMQVIIKNTGQITVVAAATQP